MRQGRGTPAPTEVAEPPPPPEVRPGTAATASTPLLGRDAELGLLRRLLAGGGGRLVTLTGPPGVGKTRLALAAAAALRDELADGAVFVDLSSVREPARVIVAAARAFGVVGDLPGVPLADRLAGLTAVREALLVLDNCEHVLDAAPDLAALLAASPRLRVLATSRERWRLAAEREVAVPPLPMPDRHDVDELERLAANPCVALLLQGVPEGDLALSKDNAAALAEVCVRLDGLPLAIQLAAGWLKLFPPTELAARLENRMSLLAGGARDVPVRHRALRTAIAWSHELLPEAERALWRRLSVFAGGWTLDAAEHVCADTDGPVGGTVAGATIVEAMASLLDKSLVTRVPERAPHAGPTRLTMLESLREYAAGELDQHAETAAVRAAHAAHFAELSLAAEARIGTDTEPNWWTWIGRESRNLRTALETCQGTGDLTAAVQLATALAWYCYTRGYLGEGRAVVEGVLARQGDATVPDDVLSGALVVSGILGWARGDLDVAEAALSRGRSLSEESGNRRRAGVAAAFLGHLARTRREYTSAAAWYRRAQAAAAELGSLRGVAWSLHDLGLLARDQGDLPAADGFLRDSLQRFREVDYPWAAASAAWALGTVALRRGRVDEAAALLGEALDGYAAADDRRGVAQCMEALAEVAVDAAQPDAAGRLLGAATALREALAAPASDYDRERAAAVGARLVRDRGPAAEVARRTGRSMSLAAAIDAAGQVVATSDPAPTGLEGTHLTRRERQVASLVASGRTNRQIAADLGVAEKTAEAHVYNLMAKLSMHSRAEVAAWAATRGLVASRRR